MSVRKRIVAVAAAGLVAAGGGAAFAAAHGDSAAPAKMPAKMWAPHAKKSPAQHHDCPNSGSGLNTAQDI
jgi:hypothetical protein